MGYYSQKAIELERKDGFFDGSYPLEENLLELRLEELRGRLAELDEIRPHNPMDPLYDRYFYEDYRTCHYEDCWTAQGILAAIYEVKERIRQKERSLREERKVLSAVCHTGADPWGQIVFISYFFPAIETILPTL